MAVDNMKSLKTIETERSNSKKNFDDELKIDTKRELVWPNIFVAIILHLFSLRGIYVYYFFQIKWETWVYATIIGHLSGLGVTVGGHRLFAHRTYKATWPLRLFLVICHTIAGQNCMHTWCRDHRQHHKFSDTDADPHNSRRGLFFCHMGWLFVRKHPLVKENGHKVDMSDLDADPFVQFQRKFYIPLYFLFSIMIPVFVPVYFWNENAWDSFCSSFCYRYVLILHLTWFVNSLAHLYGMKPYNKNIHPVENLFVTLATNGEGWHNYHHTFPWDYRAGEIGKLNINSKVIECFEKLGLAYDLKTASDKLIRSKILHSGDGSYQRLQVEQNENVFENYT